MACTKMGKALYHIQEGLLETVGSQLQDQAAEGEHHMGGCMVQIAMQIRA